VPVNSAAKISEVTIHITFRNLPGTVAAHISPYLKYDRDLYQFFYPLFGLLCEGVVAFGYYFRLLGPLIRFNLLFRP